MLSTTLVIPSNHCFLFNKSNLENVRSILKPLARMQTSWHIHLKKHWRLVRTLVAHFHLTMYNNQCWVVRTPLARALSVLQFVNQKKYAIILSRTQVVMIYLVWFSKYGKEMGFSGQVFAKVVFVHCKEGNAMVNNTTSWQLATTF